MTKTKGMSARNTSGVTGVSRHNREDKWCVSISSKNVRYQLGYFDELDDAVMARYKGEQKYGCYNQNGTSAKKYLKDKKLI